MMCFRCNNETEFLIREVELEQLYHNKSYMVLTPVTTCKECGTNWLGIGQTNELMKRMKILEDKEI